MNYIVDRSLIALRWAAVIVGTFAFASTMKAAAIAIDFGVSGSQSAMGPSETAGVFPQQHWNSFANAAGTQGSLSDDSGATTSASVTWNASNLYQVQDGQTDTAGNRRMMYGYLDNSDTSVTAITVSGLPVGFSSPGYDVYVYFDGSNGASNRTGKFALTPTGGSTQTKYGRDAAGATFNGTFIEANSSVTPTSVTSAPAGNYIHFGGLNASGFSMAIQGSLGEGFLRAPVNGIQIVAVPEPTGAVLLVLALACLAMRRFKPNEALGSWGHRCRN